MDNAILKDLISNLREHNLNVLNINVRQNNQTIAEYDFIPQKPHLLWSISKSFTSMAVGIALHDNHFKLTDHLIDFFPDYDYPRDNPYLQQITIRDLLTMGTGHDTCPVLQADWSNNAQWDIAQLFFDEPIIHKPGSHFIYDNSAGYMLSRIISLTTNQQLDDYLYTKVFQHLNIPKPKWNTCPQGHPQGFSGLHLPINHLATFSQLILDQGIHQNQQLIPSDYIAQATIKQIDTNKFNPDHATADHHQGYGYQFWINAYPNSFRMDGLNGQFAIFLPDKNTVISIISNEPDNMMKILDLTWLHLTNKL
ncbi:beta-lactamase family protein [Planctomycetota bacterium]|nr:beta-lactamase family protein [Planctomycetota bacterium]